MFFFKSQTCCDGTEAKKKEILNASRNNCRKVTSKSRAVTACIIFSSQIIIQKQKSEADGGERARGAADPETNPGFRAEVGRGLTWASRAQLHHWILLDVCYMEGGGSRPRLDIKGNNIASGLPSSDVRVSMETDFRGVVLFLSNGEKSGVVFKPRL